MCLYLLLRLLTDPVLFCLQFPVGRTRLETVAVIVCAVIMSIATVLVIRESIGALVDGLAHRESSFFCAASHAFTILHVGSCTQYLHILYILYTILISSYADTRQG